MAVTLTMTGTSQSISATNGNANITFASGVATNWVVGATIQGIGIPVGTKILSITGTPSTSTAAVLSNNFTGTTGAVSAIISSNNATVVFSLGASGDTATPQNIINLGLGSTPAGQTNAIQIFGRTFIEIQIANGATFDDTEWTYYLGLYSYIQVNETYTGTWRSGWKLNGSTYIKAKGATIYYQQARAVQGGTALGKNSGIPVGFPANKLKLHWNDVAWIGMSGSNYAIGPQLYYGEWYQCGDIVFDYWGDSGANASFSGSYGSIEKLSMYKVIGGVQGGYDTTTVTPIGKLEWFCIPNGDTTGANPDIKLGTPNNVPVSGLAPIFYQTNPNLTFIGVNSTASEIWDDYILPNNYPLLTNSRNYSAGNRTYRRSVSFTLKDSNGNALTGVTVYVKSGSNILINAVQSGDFYQKLRTVWVDWTSRSPVSGSYIAPIQSIDNRIQTVQLRKHKYKQQSVTYDLTNAAYSQPFFFLLEASLIGVVDGSTVTEVTIDWVNKIIISNTANYDKINTRIDYELALISNQDKTDPRTILGSKLSLASGWSLIVPTGQTITAGSNITEIYVPTITLQGTGKIMAIYQDSTGTSTTLTISGFENGSAVYLEDNLGNQQFYSNSFNGNFTFYIPPTASGSWYYAIENFGYQRQSDFFTFSGGAKSIVVKSLIDSKVIGTKAATTALTVVSTPDEVYDAFALKRLSYPYISYGQIVFKDGTSLNLENSSMVIKSTATNVVDFNWNTKLITVKGIEMKDGTICNKIKANPPAIISAFSNEVITVTLEDGNGDSDCNIQGGSGSFSVFKFPIASTSYPAGGVDNRISPSNLVNSNVGNGKFRFIADPLYNYMVLDNTKGNKENIPAENLDPKSWNTLIKGSYVAGLYQGKTQIQLAQINEVYDIQTTVKILKNMLTAIQGDGFNSSSDSLAIIRNYVDTIPTDVWSAVQRTLTSEGASGATIAEIIALGLAKEMTAGAIKNKVDTLNNYSDTALIAKIDAIKTVVDSIKTLAEDKTGYELTTGQVEAIATAVESHLLNDGDSQQLINAIVTAIGNSNVDETILVAAIRNDLERTGGAIDTVKAKVDTLQNADFTTTNNKIDSVKTKVDTLQNADFTATNNKIDSVKTKVDTLENYDSTNLSNKIDAIIPKLEKMNEGLQLLSNFEPYDEELS